MVAILSRPQCVKDKQKKILLKICLIPEWEVGLICFSFLTDHAFKCRILKLILATDRDIFPTEMPSDECHKNSFNDKSTIRFLRTEVQYRGKGAHENSSPY